MEKTRPTYQRSIQNCANVVRPISDILEAHSPIVIQDLNGDQIRRFGDPKPLSSSGSSVSELVSE